MSTAPHDSADPGHKALHASAKPPAMLGRRFRVHRLTILIVVLMFGLLMWLNLRSNFINHGMSLRFPIEGTRGFPVWFHAWPVNREITLSMYQNLALSETLRADGGWDMWLFPTDGAQADFNAPGVIIDLLFMLTSVALTALCTEWLCRNAARLFRPLRKLHGEAPSDETHDGEPASPAWDEAKKP